MWESKKKKIIILIKLPIIVVIGLSLCVSSFAMSPEFKKEIFDGCYLDAKSTLGNQRA